MILGKATGAEHTEAQNMPVLVYMLHDNIMGSRSHEAGSFPKLDLEVIGLRIKPDFYFLCQMPTPGCGAHITLADSAAPEVGWI